MMVLSLVIACNSSSDDNENNDGFVGSAPTVNGKYLVRINSSELQYNVQGQLLKVKNKNMTGNMAEISYSYEAKRIIQHPLDMIYYLKNGRVTECRYKVFTSIDENALEVDIKETYEYDSNGYLVKKTRPGYDFTEDVGENIQTTVYEWRDGNVYKITVTEDESVEETIISYTSYDNSIPNAAIGHYDGFDGYLGWQGYFGKRCKNLPSKSITTQRNSIPERTVTNYDYTIENGIVTKVTTKWDHDSYTTTNVFELEWY